MRWTGRGGNEGGSRTRWQGGEQGGKEVSKVARRQGGGQTDDVGAQLACSHSISLHLPDLPPLPIDPNRVRKGVADILAAHVVQHFRHTQAHLVFEGHPAAEEELRLFVPASLSTSSHCQVSLGPAPGPYCAAGGRPCQL